MSARPSLPLIVAVAFVLGSACSSHEDVLATVQLEQGAEGATSDSELAADEVRVVGSPLAQWPFEVAPWPLETPLSEFFSGVPGPDGVTVVVDGADADLLAALWARVQNGEYGPQRSTVAVEDDEGSVYLIIIQRAK